MIADAAALLTTLETATDLTGFEHDAGRVTVQFTHGVTAAQRATMWAEPSAVVLGLWICELKEQYQYVYTQPGLVESVATLEEFGWTLRPNFHVAFYNANWKQRWYPSNGMPAADYMRQWTRDYPNAGRFSRYEVEDPNYIRWLVERGYITESEVSGLIIWLRGLSRQQVDVRPSVAIERTWDSTPSAAEVRASINEVLASINEPILGEQRRLAVSAPAPRAAAKKAPPKKRPTPPAERPMTPCPNCFVALPATGVCDCG